MARSVQDPPGRGIEGPPSVRIVEAIADARGDDSTDLEPLYGQFDLEAIDHLVQNSRGDLRVEMTVDGYLVAIRGDGVVEVS